MDQESKAYLDKTVLKEVYSLTDFEIAFIRARRDYLTPEQRIKFSSILKEKIFDEKTGVSKDSYEEVLKQAKEKGYNGPRISRSKLEEYLKV
jgi:hypothetical protein